MATRRDSRLIADPTATVVRFDARVSSCYAAENRRRRLKDMSRTLLTAVLVVSASALPVSTVFAQALAPSGTPTTSHQGRVRDDVPTCQGAGGGSRVRANCEAQDTQATVRTEQKLKVSLDAPPQPSAPQCEATATTDSFQSNAVARVDGTINIRNCSAGSAGTYNIVVRVRDENGEINSLEFSDKWQRSDGQDVKFAADYPIGQNVDLVNVRLHDLRCTCADPPADPAPDPAPDLAKKN
jgi:hypothetical protein